MDTRISRRWTLISHPTGTPSADNFSFDEVIVPDLGANEVLLQNMYISIDPGQRVYISAEAGARLGAAVHGWAVGRVIASNSDKYPVGSFAQDRLGQAGVQSLSVVAAKNLLQVPSGANLPTRLGALGMPGLTAYFGMMDVIQPKAGETVLISGAAGAVGAIAGQIARIKGCRVVGIVGGKDKARYITAELGFHDSIDHREGPLAESLAEHCPAGVDALFDNVAGDLVDACLPHMRMKGRIAFCGAVSSYNAGGGGLKNYFQLLIRQLRWQGFYVGAYEDRFEAAIAEMSEWVDSGELRHREDIELGIERFPEIFLKVFDRERFGKLVLQVDPGLAQSSRTNSWRTLKAK
ncbi:MAG: NADP-dependent oxidoreductase [Caulobacterales bacterium]